MEVSERSESGRSMGWAPLALLWEAVQPCNDLCLSVRDNDTSYADSHDKGVRTRT